MNDTMSDSSDVRDGPYPLDADLVALGECKCRVCPIHMGGAYDGPCDYPHDAFHIRNGVLLCTRAAYDHDMGAGSYSAIIPLQRKGRSAR